MSQPHVGMRTADNQIRHPLTGQTYSLGGTPAANAHARADSWPRVLQILRNGSNAVST